MRTPALLAAGLVTLLGIGVAVFFVFGPTITDCMAEAPSQGTDPAVPTCTSTSLFASQQLWPMPLIAIVVWGSAPLIALVGAVRLRGGARGRPLLYLGLALEASVLISFGAAPLFVPLVFLPLLATTALVLKTAPRAPIP
jgi:hypothetical protein